MKERSLTDRIMAILGVLMGSVAWVVRLLFSLVQGAVKDALGRGGSAAKGSQESSSGSAAQQDEKEKGDQSFSFGSAEPTTPDVARNQHEDVGGVPPEFRTGNDEESFAGRGYTYSDTQALYGIEDQDVDHENQLTEGIPYIEEPGGGADDAGGEQRSVSDTESPVSDYAGYVKSESDIGVDRPDSRTGLAGSMDDDDGGDGDADMYDVVNREDMGSHATTSGETNGVSAASRGWTDGDEDPLADDPLYGDFESMETGEEVDLRNDEATDESASGMHLVDSPDESFVEDDPVADAIGISDATNTPVSDTTSEGETEIDDLTNLDTTSIDEDMLAADATGQRIGGDPASGDLGIDTSYDDTQRDPTESRDPGDTIGAYDGSGVDEFADDNVADGMLNDVSMGSTEPEGNPAQGDDEASPAEEAAESAAWATPAGVVDQDLTRPGGMDDSENNQSGIGTEPRSAGEEGPGGPGSGEEVFDDFAVDGSDSDAVKAPQYDPEDASLRDVAAEMAEDIEVDELQGSTSNTSRTETRGWEPSNEQHQSGGGPGGSVRGDGSPNCPTGYPIKGNARSRIYHMPTDSSYEATVPELCFATEEDAKAAGFRPRKG